MGVLKLYIAGVGWVEIGGAGVGDHGGLAGLGDDDHSAIYPGIAQTETVTGTWIFDNLKKAMGIRNAAEYTNIQAALNDL